MPGACLSKVANSVRSHDQVLVVWYCWLFLDSTAHFVQTHVIFRRMRQEAVCAVEVGGRAWHGLCLHINISE
jgi:hypothetical protein